MNTLNNVIQSVHRYNVMYTGRIDVSHDIVIVNGSGSRKMSLNTSKNNPSTDIEEKEENRN